MYHPLVMYDLAKLRIAEDIRMAERERLLRRAGEDRPAGIDAVPFRERLSRLFGTIVPAGRVRHGRRRRLSELTRGRACRTRAVPEDPRRHLLRRRGSFPVDSAQRGP